MIPLGILGSTHRGATFAAEVLADSPLYYFPLDDAVGASAAANLGSAGGSRGVSGITFGSAGIGDRATSATLDYTAGTGLGAGFTTSWPSAAYGHTLVSPTSAGGSVPRLLTVGPIELKLSAGSGPFAITVTRARDAATAICSDVSTSAGILTAGARYLVGVSYDASNVTIYLNGAPVASTAVTGAIPTGTLTFGVGSLTSYGIGCSGRYAGLCLWKGSVPASGRRLAYATAAGL